MYLPFIHIFIFQKPPGNKQGETSSEDRFNRIYRREESALTNKHPYDSSRLHRQFSLEHKIDESKGCALLPNSCLAIPSCNHLEHSCIIFCIDAVVWKLLYIVWSSSVFMLVNYQYWQFPLSVLFHCRSIFFKAGMQNCLNWRKI